MRKLRHVAIIGACAAFAVSLGVFGFSKFGDTHILAISCWLFFAELLMLTVMLLERRELPSATSSKRTTAYRLVLVAGLFAPINLRLYYYGYHPLEFAAGAVWMYGSVLLCILAIVNVLRGPKIKLFDGYWYPALLSGLVIGSTVNYVVWLSGG